MSEAPPNEGQKDATFHQIQIAPGYLGRDTTLKITELEHEGKTLQAQFLVRTPSPALSNIVFVKKSMGWFHLSFSYVEVQPIVTEEPSDVKQIEAKVTFQDFEIACHSSVALPRSEVIKLRDKLNALLEKPEDSE